MIMRRLEALTSMKSKVEAGELSAYDCGAFAGAWPDDMPYDGDKITLLTPLHAFEGSFDAAKALHEAVLPGWKWNLDSDHGADVNNRETEWTDKYKGAWIEKSGKADTPARAWLLAILEALIEMEKNSEKNPQ
jgi:hypothetical protein